MSYKMCAIAEGFVARIYNVNPDKGKEFYKTIEELKELVSLLKGPHGFEATGTKENILIVQSMIDKLDLPISLKVVGSCRYCDKIQFEYENEVSFINH